MYEDEHESFIVTLANQITMLEVVWPLPLLLVGIAGILNPIAVGVAIFLALLPWLARWVVFGHLTRPAFLTTPLILFLISGFLGVWASYQPSLSWPLMLTLLGSISLFYALVNATVPPRWLVSTVIGVATVLALYFITQYGYFFYPDESGTLHELGRLTGSILPDFAFFSPYINGVAAFLSGAFLLSLVTTWQARDDGALPWAIPVLIMAYALLVTSSRGAWVSLIVVISLWVFLTIPERRRGVLLAIAFVGVVGLSGLIVAAILFPQAATSLQETAVSRFNIYRNSLYLMADYPFTGVGLGDTFALTYARYQLLIQVPFLTHSHNLFISVGLGQGILGLISLAWLMVAFYYLVWRVEQVGLSERPLLLFRGAWLGVTATFIHGMTDAPQFSDRWTMPMLFVLMGLTVDIGRPALLWADEDEGSDELPVSSLGWGRWVVAGGLTALLAVGIIFHQPIMAAWYANLGSVYHTQADLTNDLTANQQSQLTAQAVSQFEQALAVQPTQPVAHRRLGLIALNAEEFEQAVSHLEVAYQQNANNQANLKALGLAYTWTGQFDQAAQLLQQLDSDEEIVEELGNWRNWWRLNEREQLAQNAEQVLARLTETTN